MVGKASNTEFHTEFIRSVLANRPDVTPKSAKQQKGYRLPSREPLCRPKSSWQFDRVDLLAYDESLKEPVCL